MMNFSAPDDVKHKQQITAGDISYVYYTEKSNTEKNRVIFNQHAISFVLNGTKEIYRSLGNTVVSPGSGILIPAGNSIIAEHSNNQDPYSSLIIFFPAELAISFLNKQHAVFKGKKADEPMPDYILFKRTTYLFEYVKALKEMINLEQEFSYAVALHKLEELLLVLYEIYPQQLIALFISNKDEQQLSLKRMVENNLFNNLPLAELAFLANRSLSSFKRDFEKTYGISPQKYIRDKKLESACHELAKGKQAAELYLAYGYENLSNFNTAFKKRFGVTPAGFTKASV